MLNSYRPAELAPTGASEEQWDAAVYATLDRATLLRRLLQGDGSGSTTASSGFGTAAPSALPGGTSSTAGSGSSAGSAAAATAEFGGPVAALLPRDRLGELMLEATQRRLRHAAAAAAPQVLSVPLEARHTECFLSEQARQATAVRLTDTIRAVLPQL